MVEGSFDRLARQSPVERLLKTVSPRPPFSAAFPQRLAPYPGQTPVFDDIIRIFTSQAGNAQSENCLGLKGPFSSDSMTAVSEFLARGPTGAA